MYLLIQVVCKMQYKGVLELLENRRLFDKCKLFINYQISKSFYIIKYNEPLLFKFHILRLESVEILL